MSGFDHERMRELVSELEQEVLGASDVPDDLRYRLHVLASSMHDYTFWVQERADGTYVAREIESGSESTGPSPQGALVNYFGGWNVR